MEEDQRRRSESASIIEFQRNTVDWQDQKESELQRLRCKIAKLDGQLTNVPTRNERLVSMIASWTLAATVVAVFVVLYENYNRLMIQKGLMEELDRRELLQRQFILDEQKKLLESLIDEDKIDAIRQR